MNNIFEVIGTIQFDPPNETKKHEIQGGWKKTAFINIGGDIHLYYQWLLNKRFNLKLNKPLRQPHVTFISDRIKDLELYEQVKKQFDGKQVSVFYNPSEIRAAVNAKTFHINNKEVRGNMMHWWIKTKCPHVEPIRTLLGLSPEPHNKFHLSIGYVNELEDKFNKDIVNINFLHSKYILDQILKYNL